MDVDKLEPITYAAAVNAAKKYADSKHPNNRVTTLDTTPLTAETIETVGTPIYVDSTALPTYSAYGLTETGWYVFARITSPVGVAVGTGFAVAGAAGYITPTTGADHVDVAVRFGTSAQSCAVTVTWVTGTSEVFVFKSTDLAVHNLDYRVQYRVYDLEPYCTWTWAAATGTFAAGSRYFAHYIPAEVTAGAAVTANTYYERSGMSWALTADTTFQSGKSYFTYDATKYALATFTAGQSIPADIFFKHTAVTFSGFARNVSYYCSPIDCPVTIALPVIAEDGYGAWFEIQAEFLAAYSITFTPAAGSGQAMSTTSLTATQKGVNVINLQYYANQKLWGGTNNVWAHN